jgi:phytoene/squalene synthetase
MFIAAQAWEKDRFDAALVCYKSLRKIDDLVDNRKSISSLISKEEKADLTAQVDAWIEMIRGNDPPNQSDQILIETIKEFKIPLWPWNKFAKSMLYDIQHNEFDSLETFFTYAEGAAVAPASIFVHFCGITQQNNEYLPPSFDITHIAEPTARFSYLVHIIRDFQADQQNNLNYFAHDLVVQNRLTQDQLKRIAKGGNIPPAFRNLVNEYYSLADRYRQKSRQAITDAREYLPPQYALSLEVVYELYSLVFNRIDPKRGIFTTEELTPTPEQVQDTVGQIVANF